jgi:peroxiredoxin
MAKTESTMLELGTNAPDFSLKNVLNGETVSRADFEGHPLLVMFICAHCPFVLLVQEELAKLGRDYADTPLKIVAISSNSIESHPQDAPEKLAEQANEQGFNFPYLFDATQEVAKAYTAACTPDFFLFDTGHNLAYRGQLDNARPGSDTPVTGKDLRAAIDAVLGGKDPVTDQTPSMGCNIKWIPGNEPEYFG